jgi:phosphoglycolate phosphatase-like HAD superfamily hydrolase
MHELAHHFERMRACYPHDDLCVVFDIDGTVVDTRHLVVDVLLSYDRDHGTEHFQGLRPDDITVPERFVDQLLGGFSLPDAVRDDIRAWYLERLESDAFATAYHPYRGVLGVIRWFQLQPRTCVALNTGRPESVREVTMAGMEALGREYRVRFAPDLLMMNPNGWDRRVEEGKVDALRRLRDAGIRIVAVVDNEPANLARMAEADDTREILFLHADTLFESHGIAVPRSVSGTEYSLSGLIAERHVPNRTQFVWHGVNDAGNLRQFLGSDVRWAECDVRTDPFGRLVVRHDSFDELPWRRSEPALTFDEWLVGMQGAGRSTKLDLKENGPTVGAALAAVGAHGIGRERLWINANIEVLRAEGFRRAADAVPGVTISCPIDFLQPMFLAAPEQAIASMSVLASWGVNRASLAWTTPNVRLVMSLLEEAGWQVNLYGVPDLESFLEAALMEPASLTADFNFPEWGYFGRGSGARGRHHRYGPIPSPVDVG